MRFAETCGVGLKLINLNVVSWQMHSVPRQDLVRLAETDGVACDWLKLSSHVKPLDIYDLDTWHKLVHALTMFYTFISQVLWTLQN